MSKLHAYVHGNQIQEKIKEQGHSTHSSKFLSDKEIIPKLVEMIDAAKTEILLVTPWFYHEEIMNTLIKKRLEGVLIKIITRQFKHSDNPRHYKTILKLDENGIQVDFISNIHSKKLIVDNFEMLISSKNLTETFAIDCGIWSNIHSEVKKARRIFFELYNQRFCR